MKTQRDQSAASQAPQGSSTVAARQPDGRHARRESSVHFRLMAKISNFIFGALIGVAVVVIVFLALLALTPAKAQPSQGAFTPVVLPTATPTPLPIVTPTPTPGPAGDQ